MSDRQHTDDCIVPADFPAVTVRPWVNEPGEDSGVTERIVLTEHGDAAGYDDAPGYLNISGGDVPIEQAEEQALAVLAVARAMREAGLGGRG